MSSSAAADARSVLTANPVEAPQEAGTQVLAVQRMSVNYDGLEDRIAMDVASPQGRVARLWLTRYGADVMVRTAAAQVESGAALQLARARVAPASAGQIRHSALAAQQLTARLTQRSASAVQRTVGSTEHLVTGFAMPPHSRGIRIEFRCRPQLKVTMVLQSAELFQWLGAVQRQYLCAGWPTDAWPAWLSQRAAG